MEADAELDHRRDPRVARHQQAAARRPVDGGDHLQERALPRSVASDQADRFAAVRSVSETPFSAQNSSIDCAPLRVQQAEEADLQLDRGVVPEQEPLRRPICASMTGIATRAAP